MVLCHYCGGLYKNMQALRAHLKRCKKENKNIAFSDHWEKMLWLMDIMFEDAMTLQLLAKYNPDPEVIKFLNNMRKK